MFWFIIVDDGSDFLNSKYPIWGGLVKNMRNIRQVSKINKDDIICFITSKKHGGKIIGFAEFINFYNKEEETVNNIHTNNNTDWINVEESGVSYTEILDLEEIFVQINTKTNEEMGWSEKNNLDIYLHYKNLYIVNENVDIRFNISCIYKIFNENIKNLGIEKKIKIIKTYYNIFKYHAESKKFE